MLLLKIVAYLAFGYLVVSVLKKDPDVKKYLAESGSAKLLYGAIVLWPLVFVAYMGKKFVWGAKKIFRK